jgi:hypothetical protein
LLRLIPRGPSGKIVNNRMRQLYKLLRCYAINESELHFFEQEISLCRKKYDRWKLEYFEHKANPLLVNPPYDTGDFGDSMNDGYEE